MSRIKRGVAAKPKRKKVLKLARGYYGARSKQYSIAKQSVITALARSFSGRKQVKREYRRLWITRINAAARQGGMSYSRFMNGLKQKNIQINRKMLADLAVHDAKAFMALVEKVK